MRPVFVLVHSPSVGPSTWAGVGNRLAAAGCDVVIPSLLDVGDGEPPYWPRVVAGVARALEGRPAERELSLVLHSNAGLFAPVLVEHLGRPVSSCLLVDAALPERAGSTSVAAPDWLEVLRAKAVDGRLPPWSQWWDEADIAPLFPDAAARAALTAEEPSLPIAYYEQRIPVPASWSGVACGYLLFGPPYEEAAADARERGWLVEQVAGLHLHQMVDPAAVAERLLGMADRLRT